MPASEVVLGTKKWKIIFLSLLFLQTDKEISEKRNFFTLRPVTRKLRDMLRWAIKGLMMALHRGPNALLANNGCRAVLTIVWSLEVE